MNVLYFDMPDDHFLNSLEAVTEFSKAVILNEEIGILYIYKALHSHLAWRALTHNLRREKRFHMA